MAVVELGETVTVSWTPTASELASGPTLAVRAPDSTPSTPAATEVNDGYTDAYSASFTANQAGRWLLSWANSAGAHFTDVLDVWPADPRFLFSLEDARKAVSSITAAGVKGPIDEDDLRLYMASATEVIEDIVGPVLVATKTKTVNGGKSAISIDMGATAITSVTAFGNPITDWTADLAAGIVYAGSGQGGHFVRGMQNIVITYTAGSNVIPPNIRLAAREELRFLWQIGRQGPRPGNWQAAQAEDYTPSGFAVPRRVIELCAGARQLPGFA